MSPSLLDPGAPSCPRILPFTSPAPQWVGLKLDSASGPAPAHLPAPLPSPPSLLPGRGKVKIPVWEADLRLPLGRAEHVPLEMPHNPPKVPQPGT